MKKTLMTLLGIGLLTAVGTAQMAPRDTAKAMLGGHSVAVEYGQPALKGRDLGALVSQLPEDRMWRAGSEQVTTFTAEAPVMVGGKTVPAGTYSVYIHCGDNNAFSFVLNEVVGQPLGKIWDQAPAEMAKEPWPHFAYSKEIGSSEVARVAMKQGQSGTSRDLLTFAFEEKGPAAILTMSWGDQSWSVPVKAGN